MGLKIKKVAVAGPNGNTGPTVIKTLVASGFEVTAVTRFLAKTRDLLGPDIDIIEVDYLSQDSLVSALRGIDAVVVCGVGMYALIEIHAFPQLTQHSQVTRAN